MLLKYANAKKETEKIEWRDRIYKCHTKTCVNNY